MTSMAERLVKAKKPSRELDYRIAYAIGWRFDGFEWDKQSRDQDWLSDKQFRDLGHMAGGWKRPSQKKWPYPGTNDNEVAFYTASVDAAMTLIPEDYHLDLRGLNDGWYVALNDTRSVKRGPDVTAFTGRPAMSICLAALRVLP